MFGKHFASMYLGSMCGAGPVVFAVWGYVISNATIRGTVEINPFLLATILGCKQTEVDAALAYLQKPDPHSRNQEQEGRRLIYEGGFQYLVVSYDLYRKIRNEEERRVYNAQKMRECRAKKKAREGEVA